MNEYDEILAGGTRQALRQTMYGAVGTNPDEFAQARKLAQATQLPAEVVARNKDAVQRDVTLNEYDALVTKAPGLARQYAENPDFAKLAHDDSSILSGIESAVRSLVGGRRQTFDAALPPVVRSAQFSDAVRRAMEQNPALDADAARALVKASTTVDNQSPFAGPVRGPELSIGGLFRAVGANYRTADAGLGVAAADALGFDPAQPLRRFDVAQARAENLRPELESSTAQGLYSGAMSLVQNAPGIALSVATGNPLPGLALAGTQVSAESYGKYRTRGGTAGEAATGALLEGGIEVATEALPMGFLVNRLGKAGAGDFLKGLLARELPGEQVATLAQDAVDTAIANPNKTWGEYLAERPDAAYQTLLATLVQTGAMGALNSSAQAMLPERARAGQAEQAAQQVEQLTQLMTASKLRGRDATEFNRFVAQIAEETGEAPAELYVDAEQLVGVLNQSAINLTELRAIAPAVADQLEAARNMPGADIRLPVAELAAAGPDITTALLDHLRESPDAMSRAEAQEFMAKEGDRIRQEVEQTLGRQQEANAFRESMKAVEDDVRQQLAAVGRFSDKANEAYAALWGSFFGTQAARAGVTPQELYAKFGPKIVAQTRATALLDQFVPIKPLRQALQKAVDKATGGPLLQATPWALREDPSPWMRSEALRQLHNKVGELYDETESQEDAVDLAMESASPAQAAVLRALKNDDWLGFDYPHQALRAVMEEPLSFDLSVPLKGALTKLSNRPGFEQAGDDGKAEITRGSFDPSTNTLALLAAADLSTFLHESGHFFLEVQFELANKIQRSTFGGAEVSDSERQIVADMERILDWFGIKSDGDRTALDAWAMMDLEQRREFHEQWARGFERYLMEGQAPNLDLQALFARFRAWLVQVYRTLSRLDVDLSDDVRTVMDRMLASDAAISEAQDARALGPLFRSADKAGMTAEEYAEYQATAERATAAASAEVDTRLMKDLKWLSRARDKAIKARQAEVDALRKEVEREVRSEVMSTSLYRAWSFLTGRETRVDGAKRVTPAGEETENLFAAIGRLGGLDRDQVKAQWGLDGKNDDLRSGLFGQPVLRKTGGLSIDAMAERLVEAGYLLPDESGKADLSKFEALFDDQRRGVDRFSIRKQYQGEEQVQAMDLPEVAAGRLNTADLKAMYGEAPTAKWRLLSERRMTSPTGIHPDVVAETFGFESGDQLVSQLARAQPPQEVIEAMTDAQMVERHGDIASPQALARAADEAVHNELRARVIATELKALAKANTVRQTGDSLLKRETIDVMAKAAQEFAAKVIARQRIKDLRPAQYAAAEARSAKLAEQALGKSTQEAALHKRNQLVNNYATKAAYEAQREVQAGREFFRKVLTGAQDKVSKTRDFDVVQAARAILADYGIGTKGEAAQRYLEAVQRNDPGMYAVLRDKVDNLTLNAKPLNELTVEEYRGLVEEIQSLWHLAKRSRQMEVDGQLIDIEAAKLPIVDRLQDIGIPDRVPGEGRAVTDAERRLGRLRSAGAALRRVESWVEAKDGQPMGPFRRFVWQPVKAAADRYRTDKGAYLKRYRDLLAGVEFPVARIDAPELGYTFGFSRGGSGKAEILHALLHTGNASNKRKLLLGRQWGQTIEGTGEMDTRRWDSFVNRMIREGVLTRADFAFAQGVWDLLEQMKPLAQRAHRDVFGRYFDEVTADGFTIQFPDGAVTYRGGYVPAVMDPEVVKDAATRSLQEDENATLAYAFPSTPKGFTKARVEINRPLLLDLRYLGQHIDKVLLFSHLEQPIRDVRKILTSREVSEPLHRVDPAAYDGLLTPWMNRAARQTVETRVPGDNNLMRFFSKARSRAGMAAMFANVINTAQQVTGLSIAAVKVRPRLLADAMVQFAKAPRQMARAVAEASPYMATRMDSEVAAMNDAIDQILLNPSLFERAQAWTAQHAYFLQSAVDNVIGPVVWTGAYNQALEAGESEQNARRIADSVVRQTQGSTLPEDVSRFETGNAFVRLFTQFAGYFNMQANLLGTEFANVMHEQGLRRGMGRGLYVFTLGFLVPAMVSELIVQAGRGGPEDEDNDGTLDDWLMAVLVMGNVRAGLAMIPGVGQTANAAINTFNGKPYDDRISTSPAISMIESAVKAPVSVYKAVADEGNRRTAVRDLATLISMTTGLPANAVARPVGYLAGVSDDRIEPTDPLDAIRGTVTGVASPESKR